MSGALTRWRLWLGLKWLWVRWYYPFNWAHKPLCDRFRHDVLRLGHVRICRSCTMVYAGLAATLVLGGVFRPQLGVWGPTVLLAIGAVTLAMSAPRWYNRWPRAIRDVLRFALGAVIALCCWMPLVGQWFLGPLAAGVLWGFWRWYFRQRGGRKAQCCNGCSELGRDRICSGFAWQAARIREFEENATDLLANTADNLSTD